MKWSCAGCVVAVVMAWTTLMAVETACAADPREYPEFGSKPANTVATDRIIVKFRETIREPADIVQESGAGFVRVAPSRGDDLDNLNKQFGVSVVTPLFADLPAKVHRDKRWRTSEGRRELHQDRIRQTRERFGVRSSRAPHQMNIPDLSRTYILWLPPGTDIAAACRAYAANPNVEYAVPSNSYAPQSTVNDPYFWSAGTWGNSYDDLWGVKKIQADQAWNTARGDGVVVAIVDTGLDYTHSDIAANVWSNTAEAGGTAGIDDDSNGYVDDFRGTHFYYDYLQKKFVSNNDVTDMDGHGTFVAGIIAAVGDNNSGIVGVAPEAKIMPVKIMENNGFNASEAYANGILYAAHNGADVINLSWGCSDCSESAGNPVVADAIAVARSLGVVVVTAAGNWRSDTRDAFPAGLPGVITVSSTDNEDAFSSFSNRGFLVDVAAPGGQGWYDGILANYSILSLKAGQAGSTAGAVVGGNYLRSTGTSASAAYVSGVAALILSANPTLTADQVTSIIRHSADDQVGGIKDSPGYDPFLGWGRVNAARAVAMAQSPPADPPVLRVAGNGLNFNIPQSLCSQERSFTFDIFNVGGGALAWTLAPPSWLAPVTSSGTGNASPAMKIVADQGVSGDITVNSNAAEGGPAALPISVSVMPDIKLTNCTMTLSAASGNQQWDQSRNSNPPAIPDGNGGAYYTWYSDSYVYLQHLDSNGSPLWPVNGVRVSSTNLFQYSPTVISDGSGGAIVLWIQGLNTGNYADKNLAAQRVSSNGQLLWGSGGIAVTTGGNVTEPVLVTDNSGGALVGWTLLGTDNNLYVQRISASGALLWQSGGYPLSSAPSEQFALHGVADGTGGAWFTWIDRRNPSHDVFGQHLDRSGTPLWPANGRKLNTQSSGSTSPNLVSDGAGGAIIAWYDFRNHPMTGDAYYSAAWDIYASHVDSTGKDLWTPAEQQVAGGTTVTATSRNISLLADGQGGAFVSWFDIRNKNTGLRDITELYAQRVNGSGQLLWSPGGVKFLAAEGYDTAPNIVPDDNGGVLVAWQDKRFGSFDIFLQQFSSAGTPRWGDSGLWAHSGTKDQTDPFLVPLGGNRLAITWNDRSNFYSTGIDLRGEIVQLCTDHDGDGFYVEGGVCGPVKATDPVLIVEATGPGRGTVQSLPSGINCGADCSVTFAPGSVVTLKAVAAPHSHFASWSGGGCSGNGDCTVTLTENTTVRAQFSAARPVKIAENNATIYTSPQQAYNNALSGNTIISWAQSFNENLTLNQPVTVKLKGGYDTDFVNNPDATVIKGALIISNGTVTVENIAIK